MVKRQPAAGVKRPGYGFPIFVSRSFVKETSFFPADCSSLQAGDTDPAVGSWLGMDALRRVADIPPASRAEQSNCALRGGLG